MDIVNNKYVSTAITIGLGLYAALLGPELPSYVKDLFQNTLFRMLILFLVVVRGNKDPKMAIMIAVAFILTLDYLYVRDTKETFSNMVKCEDNKVWDGSDCVLNPKCPLDKIWNGEECVEY